VKDTPSFLSPILKLLDERERWLAKAASVDTDIDRAIRELARSGDYREVALRTLYWDFQEHVAPARLAKLFGLEQPGALAEAAGQRRIKLTCLVCETLTLFKPTSRTALDGLLTEKDTAIPVHRICVPCKSKRDALLTALRKRKKGGRLAEGHRARYHAYLKSDAWRERRAAALKKARNRCSLCNGRFSLEAHHRTYERLGQERPDDLIVLCCNCHERHHG